MYTAKINRKDYVAGVLRVFVDFTDGVTTISENCIPQNEDGLKFWIKSRLETFNSASTIESTYADGADVDVSDPVVTPPVLTQAEIDQQEWLKDYAKWVKVKTTLIDTGVLTGSETQVVALKNKVTTNFKPAYLASI